MTEYVPMDYELAAAAYSEIAAMDRRMAELYARIGYIECAKICAESAEMHEQSAAHNRAMCRTTEG